jgi:hypothetical protein
MDRQYLVAALDYRLLVLVQSTRNRKGSFHSVGFDGTLSLLARTSLYRVVVITDVCMEPVCYIKHVVKLSVSNYLEKLFSRCIFRFHFSLT